MNSSIPVAVVPERLDLDGCHGFHAGVNLLSAMNPAPVPTGWEDADGTDLTTLTWLWLDCERMGFMDFERPATMLLELTSNVDPPEACTNAGEGRVAAVLLQAWVNDPELGQALESELSWEVHNASFSDAEAQFGPTWAMTTETGAALVQLVNGPTLQEASLSDRRIWWPAAAGMGQWDVDIQTTSPNVGERATIEAPGNSWLSETQLSNAAGLDETANAHYNGPLTWYESLSCS